MKWLFLIVLICLLTVAHLTNGQRAPAPGQTSCAYTEDDVRLITAVSTKTNPGAPVTVTVSMENLGAGGISWTSGGQPFFFRLVDLHGSDVAKTQLGEKELSGDTDSGFASLKAGEVLRRTYNLNRWYKINKGIYELSVTQTFHGSRGASDWGTVRSVIRFRVGDVAVPTQDVGGV